MHGLRFLHSWLRKACGSMHDKRRSALLKAVEALLGGATLTLTGLGRGLRSRAYRKHSIKRMDRLLGNAHLHRERVSVYRAMAAWLLRLGGWVVVVVDWSDCPDRRFLMLKAAVPVGGRALAVYHEVHPLWAYKNARVHGAFLQRLSTVIPPGCGAIVVTDAGFQRAWFKAVERLGWHWVGRLCEPVNTRRVGERAWGCITRLYAQASAKPRELGMCEIAKRTPYRGRLCLIHRPKRLRRDRASGRAHGHGTVDRRCRKLHAGPWVIATSLPASRFDAARVVALYEQRMQIEETFRDFKSPRYGYALGYTRNRRSERLEVLLLIATLAMFVQWLTGLAGELRDWSAHFQANTVRTHRVLSMFFLGRELLRNQRFKLRAADFRAALERLPYIVANQALPG